MGGDEAEGDDDEVEEEPSPECLDKSWVRYRVSMIEVEWLYEKKKKAHQQCLMAGAIVIEEIDHRGSTAQNM